ncbi:methylenetetrahydrofolate reductase [Corynebacterium mendelii]|uniref:Methylenetetrahydrofolate reductase n=1 Tax=Corynebacterium mendelii TaxID=2765362 RepID=A0A939DXL8_9CORY|nr:methylenetetrahydrofolate reductase [Corynebacterium mendelii]MBN9643089.1 methylenetetrahydrofolate reductase [Corynebacterium mendelii]
MAPPEHQAINQLPITEAIARPHPGRVPFSVEFMPPRTEAAEQQMWEAVDAFHDLGAAFASVTYGAGGSTRGRTSRIAREFARRPIPTLVHLTLVNHTVEELEDILWIYAGLGLTNLLALRGDPPGNPRGRWQPTEGGLNYALDLIKLVRRLPETSHFEIGIASFPEGHIRAASVDDDTLWTLAKLRAGADYSITQMFFDPEYYLRLRDRLVEADPEQGAKPIIPGIMPVTSLRSITRQVELSGAHVPDHVMDKLTAAAGGDEKANAAAVREAGIEISTSIAERLIAEGVPGLHFMTLNRERSVHEVLHNLGLAPAPAADVVG